MQASHRLRFGSIYGDSDLVISYSPKLDAPIPSYRSHIDLIISKDISDLKLIGTYFPNTYLYARDRGCGSVVKGIRATWR